MLRFLPLPEKFVVLPGPPPALSPSVEEAVRAIWQEEQAKRGPKLFNGTLFSVEQAFEKTVRGRFVEYRRFVAQVQRPEFFPDLRVHPLAVTGLLQNAEGIFFGHRNSGMAQQPSCWELIPAGGIDASTLTEDEEVEPHKQILDELKEEVGLDPATVTPPRLIAFCEEPEHHVFDLVWELETSLESKTVTAAHAGLSEPEHVNVICVGWGELEGFLAESQRAIAAGNRDLIKHLAPHKRRV